MSKLKEWFEWDGKTPFEPLRLTVTGKPGTGKSVVIQVIQNLCYIMFKTSSCVQVCAPTGGAAYNAGGQTCHQQWGLSRNPSTYEMSTEKKKYICKMCMNTLVLILDECSLIDAYSFGFMENNVRQSVYSSRCQQFPWGGVPVIVLFGDHFQLLSISFGVLEMMDFQRRQKILCSVKNPVAQKFISAGWDQFIVLANKVLSLSTPKRVYSSNKELLEILDCLRGEESSVGLEERHIQRLLSLRINNSQQFSSTQQRHIKENSLCLFATKEKNHQHNSDMLLKLNQYHPICMCKAITMRQGKQVSLNSHYDSDRVPSYTLLVKNATVQLSGWNAKPEWGLFHGSMGKIIDIVYRQDESPSLGYLPLYVLVDFHLYIGPAFDEDHPTYVPIPVHIARCQFNCGCERTYVPLTLAFGKTIHSFQGQNVGPTCPGQPKNSVQHIVVEPGTRSFEGNSPGLLYSVISRITTLGDPFDLFTLALFFHGDNINRERLQNITYRNDSKPYAKFLLCTKWVTYLKLRSNYISWLTANKSQLINSWLNTFCPNLPQILRHLDLYCARINSSPYLLNNLTQPPPQ